jgi:hypothetical protein
VSYSQCEKALGRGSRYLSSSAKGTIICEAPLTLDAAEYLELLRNADDEVSQAMRINSKVARILHKVPVKKLISDDEALQLFKEENIKTDNEPYLAMFMIKCMMETGENFRYMEGGAKLWSALKKLDKSGNMPSDCYQEWNR